MANQYLPYEEPEPEGATVTETDICWAQRSDSDDTYLALVRTCLSDLVRLGKQDGVTIDQMLAMVRNHFGSPQE